MDFTNRQYYVRQKGHSIRTRTPPPCHGKDYWGKGVERQVSRTALIRKSAWKMAPVKCRVSGSHVKPAGNERWSRPQPFVSYERLEKTPASMGWQGWRLASWLVGLQDIWAGPLVLHGIFLDPLHLSSSFATFLSLGPIRSGRVGRPFVRDEVGRTP